MNIDETLEKKFTATDDDNAIIRVMYSGTALIMATLTIEDNSTFKKNGQVDIPKFDITVEYDTDRIPPGIYFLELNLFDEKFTLRKYI